jgi:hypothetical protein
MARGDIHVCGTLLVADDRKMWKEALAYLIALRLKRPGPPGALERP